jgi:hypothetical protein
VSAAPIRVRCEGSACPPAFPGVAICPMCGQVIALADGTLVAHDRDDLLAMLARGDFG